MQTARLILEPLRAAHADALFAGLSDPALYRFIPQEPPASAAALRAVFARRERGTSPDGSERWLNWAARLQSGSYVGLFEATVRQDWTADIAYFVFAAHARQGFAKEACRAVVEHLLTEFGARKVGASMDARNAASIALAESLGLTRAGMTRNADQFKGAPSHEYRYELLRPADGKTP